jgi:hypothetical protein
MIPLHRDSHFTFRFDGDRVVPCVHLAGLAAGVRVSVFGYDATTERWLGLIATATVGENGRVGPRVLLAVWEVWFC